MPVNSHKFVIFTTLYKTFVLRNCMDMTPTQPTRPNVLSALSLPALALALACFGAFTPETASAQDPEFTQFYSNPVYLNPAFAGCGAVPPVCHELPESVARDERQLRDLFGCSIRPAHPQHFWWPRFHRHE